MDKIKHTTTIRLSVNGKAIRDALSERLGLDGSAILELALRRLADIERLDVGTVIAKAHEVADRKALADRESLITIAAPVAPAAINVIDAMLDDLVRNPKTMEQHAQELAAEYIKKHAGDRVPDHANESPAAPKRRQRKAKAEAPAAAAEVAA